MTFDSDLLSTESVRAASNIYMVVVDLCSRKEPDGRCLEGGSAMQEAPEKVVSFPRTTFMKEIGHGSSPGKVSFPRTTFMKEIGHGSSPGKVSFPRTTFMKEIGHGSSPGKVSCLTTTFMKDFFT